MRRSSSRSGNTDVDRVQPGSEQTYLPCANRVTASVNLIGIFFFPVNSKLSSFFRAVDFNIKILLETRVFLSKAVYSDSSASGEDLQVTMATLRLFQVTLG